MGIAEAEVVKAAARASSFPQGNQRRLPGSTEQVRVKRETIQAVLDQCQKALKLLEEPDLIVDADPDVSVGAEGKEKPPLSFSTADSDADVIHAFTKGLYERCPYLLATRLRAMCQVVNLKGEENDIEEMDEDTKDYKSSAGAESMNDDGDRLNSYSDFVSPLDATILNRLIVFVKLSEMVKSRVESQSFLEKLGSMHASVSQSDCAWEMVGTSDLWENKQFGVESKDDLDGYVLVNQEDIVEGIVSFMAAYILSLKDAKELAPNQLQKALSKTFSVKKKKSKLMKAWEGSQVIYNVTSWGATAVGIYQNPAIIKAASVAILSSCRVISKFL